MQSFSGTGLVVLLNWMTHPGMQQHHDHKLLPPSPSYCDFNRERGKVRCEDIVKIGYQVSRSTAAMSLIKRSLAGNN
ncbi:MAG: hypothetical protein ACK56I_20935, partial [bacterium]